MALTGFARCITRGATGCLLITECTVVMPNTSAFVAEPGIGAQEPIEGWKKTTAAVHTKGGRIQVRVPLKYPGAKGYTDHPTM